ncbi:hypothetical protein FRC02_000944 [Tulasnella sp. 418]|nr:hypothetical protein FRC02_000944 [Tulasnella sp. 418]
MSSQPELSSHDPTSQSKRRRSTSPGNDDRPARRKRGPGDDRVRIGKHAARTLRIAFRADVVFRVGLKFMASAGWSSPEMEKDIDGFPDGPFSDLGLFFQLVKQIPGCLEKLQEDDEMGSYRNDVTAALEQGANTARSDDCRGLKSAILDMLSDYCENRSSRRVKHNRGFNDVALGKLLCPLRFDWEDPFTRTQLQNGDIRPTLHELPQFLYRDFIIDETRRTEGLFESELLIKAARYIFIAPSAMDNVDTSSRSTRPGNAALNNMQSITIPAIAYVATIVRFSLSSDETFTIKCGTTGKGGFDYWSFYRGIIETLRDPIVKDTRTPRIMEYWNSRLWEPTTTFGDGHHSDLGVLLQQEKALSTSANPL